MNVTTPSNIIGATDPKDRVKALADRFLKPTPRNTPDARKERILGYLNKYNNSTDTEERRKAKQNFKRNCAIDPVFAEQVLTENPTAKAVTI